MRKFASFFLFILICSPAFAQIKNYEKAKAEFEKKKYKSANSIIDKCIENKETKKNPNVYLLKSKIQFAIFKDKALKEKFPNALRDALKNADKSIDLIETEKMRESFRLSNKLFFDEIIRQNNLEAMEAYNGTKYPKALPIFKRSLSFGTDTQSLVYIGECYWQMGQRPESISYFRKAADLIYAAVLDSNTKIYSYTKLPFRRLGKYYIEKEQYDTAYVIVKNGRELLPNDPELSEYTYNLMRYALEKIPPSWDYLRMTEQNLKDFPSDSFLNHRENAIYIYLLNGMATSGDEKQFDSLLQIYAASKGKKSGLKNINLVKRYDIFAGLDKPAFYNKLYHYLADIGLSDASYMTFKAQTKALDLKQTETEKMMADRPFYADILFGKEVLKNPVAKLQRETYTIARNKETTGYYDLVALIHLNDECAKNKPKDLTFKTKARDLRTRLVREAADSNDFALARKTWQASSALYPDLKKQLDELLKYVVISDFKLNYFGTRINLKGKSEAGVPQYQFNGNVEACTPGRLSDSVMIRLERRINYFRRMAGLTEEIILTNDLNENCAIAALMCEANKSMSHAPTDGWRCFIPAGFDALKLSILSKDANPAIAVTAAMGQNHPTVGNRRWLLYPYSQYLGIGTALSYTAILAVDHSNMADTNKYKSQYIAWPPAGYSAKMTLYRKWSFSIDRSMKGATVSMKNAKGENVPLKLETPVDGYGINTLVWEPEINPQTVADNEEYTVTVKLGDGKTFTYKVAVLDIKP